jgi:hypothetical protein
MDPVANAPTTGRMRHARIELLGSFRFLVANVLVTTVRGMGATFSSMVA